MACAFAAGLAIAPLLGGCQFDLVDPLPEQRLSVRVDVLDGTGGRGLVIRAHFQPGRDESGTALPPIDPRILVHGDPVPPSRSGRDGELFYQFAIPSDPNAPVPGRLLLEGPLAYGAGERPRLTLELPHRAETGGLIAGEGESPVLPVRIPRDGSIKRANRWFGRLTLGSAAGIESIAVVDRDDVAAGNVAIPRHMLAGMAPGSYEAELYIAYAVDPRGVFDVPRTSPPYVLTIDVSARLRWTLHKVGPE